ncbi:hypothetical protein [Citreimonas salinaria]|uniref:Uncharacterized protein n=1 Tax=Citreimonas salinaria TaxID=321339 RepID=A0A1H3N7F5_9RHOB|nr:hypothetical protein [Citreimonas salinaria]SDY84600.1 hypothetical protein SAMN05444340_12111 [Citreimonas salinaria]
MTDLAAKVDLLFAFPVDDEDDDRDDITDAIRAAGFDDAVIGFDTPGVVELGFKIEGKDHEALIFAAIDAARWALPFATLREINASFVSQRGPAKLSVSM